jgi:hypothetical protein
MAGSPIQEAAEAVTAGFAGFEPQNATDLRTMFSDFPDFYGELARGVGILADKFDGELPVHPSVAEGIREMVATLAGLRDHADELNGMFKQAHEKELQRLDEPRPQEELWDVSRNND